MQGVLAGFATIGVLIGLGFLLASLRVLDATAQGVLTRTAFYVTSPALMSWLRSMKREAEAGMGRSL